MTRAQLPERIGVGQRQISKIECGELEDVRIRTLRDYMDAVGAELSVSSVRGDKRTRIG